MTTPTPDQTLDALTATERYDALAEQFYAETRIHAPGKDVSAAEGGREHDADVLRHKLFEQWKLTRKWKAHSVEQAARIVALETVTDAMVEAACESRFVNWNDVIVDGYDDPCYPEWEKTKKRKKMRKNLTAALAARTEGHANG